MKKLSILMLFLMALGLGVSCDRTRDIDDGIQREESPLRDAGDELEDGVEDVGDRTEDVVDEVD